MNYSYSSNSNDNEQYDYQKSLIHMKARCVNYIKFSTSFPPNCHTCQFCIESNQTYVNDQHETTISVNSYQQKWKLGNST